jgi:hypothetical protein
MPGLIGPQRRIQRVKILYNPELLLRLPESLRMIEEVIMRYLEVI